MGCFAPVQQTLDLVLEGEYDANSTRCQYAMLTLSSLNILSIISETCLALNRRKLCVIKGRLKAGRLGSTAAGFSPDSTGSPSLSSSTGNICCKNLVAAG